MSQLKVEEIVKLQTNAMRSDNIRDRRVENQPGSARSYAGLGSDNAHKIRCLAQAREREGNEHQHTPDGKPSDPA